MDMASLLDSASHQELEHQEVEQVKLLGVGEILLAKLDAIDESGRPLVSVSHIPEFNSRPALATVPVLPQHIGRQVALMFTHGAASQPVVIGFIHSPLSQILDVVLTSTESNQENSDEVVFAERLPQSKSDDNTETLHIDGKRILLEGREEVVLRCGESSITLNANGKISIRGKYLLSRSSGVNRILGGSVQVN
jgi:Domain of unknown function (DUF6484)